MIQEYYLQLQILILKDLKMSKKIELKEFVDNMFETMKKYGGIGLSANQVGKVYRMFIMGDHPSISKLKVICINPKITNDKRPYKI